MTRENFVGFEDPPESTRPVGPWHRRVVVLANHHPGKWAKYGPYATSQSAAGVATQCEGIGPRYDFRVESEVVPDDDKAYLYLRVTPPPSSKKEQP